MDVPYEVKMCHCVVCGDTPTPSEHENNGSVFRKLRCKCGKSVLGRDMDWIDLAEHWEARMEELNFDLECGEWYL